MQTINEATLAKSVWQISLKDWQKSPSGLLIALFAVLFGVFICGQIFEWGDLKQISLVSDGFQAVASILSVVTAWRVTRHSAIDVETKRAWRVLTFSYFAYSFGHTLWFYYSSILEIEPFPSLADVGFLGMYPLMLAALLVFPSRQSSTNERLKFALDTAIIMIGGTIVVWHFIIYPTLENIGEDWLTPALNLSYTVGDMILMLGITTVLLRDVNKDCRTALMIIVFGILNMFVADLGFAYLTLQGTYYSGHWIDNFFISSMLAFTVSSFYQYRHLNYRENAGEDLKEEQEISARFSYLPYVAVAVGFAMLLNETKPYWGQPLGYLVFAALVLTTLVVVRQITAIKENLRLRVEQTARQSELRFHQYVQNSFDMISIRGFDRNLIYRSPSYEKMLGYDKGELEKDKNIVLVHSDDRHKLDEVMANIKKNPTVTETGEFRLRHKNGLWRVMEFTARFYEDLDTAVKGVLFNSRDITERKIAENRLIAYNKKLQSSNRELQDFAFVASHDLQEPLRKVQAFGDRLKSKCGDSISADGLDYLARMQNAAQRMQTLINDLLSFSRVTTKAQPFAKVDLAKIAHEVISDLEVKIEESKAKITVSDLPTIDADATQMRQLLQNLIGNALKFRRPEQPPIIKISAETHGESPDEKISEGFCRITVEDNGIGFEEKYLDRIFTVFQRLHARHEYEGSGIGLAVCRKIVERHNGHLTAESEVGKGTKFIFTLPLKQTEGEKENDTQS